MNRQTFYTCIAALPIIASAFFLGGCKKAASVNGLVAAYTEAKTVAGHTTVTTTTFSYDAQGRLVLESPDSGAPVTYSYSPTMVTKTQGPNVLTYTLNAQGLVSSDSQGNSYTYNSGGYCTNITNTQAATATVNTISGGNIISAAFTQNAGSANPSTTYYTYQYQAKTDYRNFGRAYFGKSNSNLPASESISTANGTNIHTYSYTFDGKGRVAVQNEVNGAESDIITYTYTSN